MEDVNHLGILLSSDIRNIKACNKLLIPDKLPVKAKSCTIEENSFCFDSEEQFRAYDACKSFFGVTKALEICKGLEIKEGVNLKLSTPYKGSNQQFLMKYASVKTREVHVDQNKVSLSIPAIKALQELGQLYDSDASLDQKEASAIDFMKLYGSHFQVGSLNYGGVFEWVVSYKDASTDNTNKANVLLEESKKLIGSHKGTWYQACDILTKNHSGFEPFTIRVTKIGGTSRNATYDSWHSDISEQKGNKAFIGGGTILPIWQIVELSKERFSDKPKFVDFLKKVWQEKITTLEITEEQRLVELFGLLPYEDIGISLADARALTTAQHTEKTASLDTVPWVILERLMRVDSRFADYKVIKSATNNNNFLRKMNLMDIFLVVFKHCTPLLQQVLVQKLILCRRCVPFVIPTESDRIEVKMWPLRAVSLNWESSQLNEVSLAKHPFKSVAFIRYGNVTKSKSYLLNGILSEQKTDIFFHRECSNGKTKRHVANGMIELSYFLPKNGKGLFDEEILFFNLRGDGLTYQKQVNMLGLMSSVLIVLVELGNLKQVFASLLDLKKKNDKVLVILVGEISEDYEEQDETQLQQHNIMVSQNTDVSFGDLVQTFSEEIKAILQGSNVRRMSIIEMIDRLGPEHLCMIDEQEFHTIQETKDCIDSIVEEIKKSGTNDEKTAKTKLLTLQGQLLHDWTRHLKQLHREIKGSDAHDAQSEKSQIQTEMQNIRKEQLQQARPLQQVLTMFLELHDNMKRSFEEENVMYKYLKMELDDISRHTLPGLRHQLECAVKEKDDIRVKKAFKDLEESTFGPEHLMREFGQIFECFKDCETELKETECNLNKKLSFIAAKYLVSGHSFEIMNGDASVVPIEWVKSVFASMQEMIGNKKMYVLSVVGIQSSGKSTILNTMFGLELTVDVARCTRGVYAQLLPVKKYEQKAENAIDYILVLDSEGLCGPTSVSSPTRDNEIATFVIGLADFTIVNIEGTNTQQIEDIFEIVVHSFLRMKTVKKYKKQKCIFLHRSVSDAGAGQRLVHDRHTLLQKLDEMTQIAAEAENMAGTIKKFNHVIDFKGDENDDAFYIPGLWQENPPMGQVSTDYSESVKKVRDTILQEIELSDTSINARDMQLRFQDMWNGILADDFLFGFKNNLLIKAYLIMESTFYTLKRKLESRLLKKIDESSKTAIESCELTEDIEKTLEQEKELIDCLFDQISKDCKSEFEELFKGRLQDELSQWKDTSIKKFKAELNDIKSDIQKELTFHAEWRKFEIETSNPQKEMIMERAKTIAVGSNREVVCQDNVEMEFENVWQEIVSGFNYVGKNLHDVETEIKKALHEIFKTKGHTKFLKNELEKQWDNDKIDECLTEDMLTPNYREYLANKDWPEDVSDTSKYGKHTNLVPNQKSRDTYMPVVVTRSNEIIKFIKEDISKKIKSNIKFHPSFIHEILQYIMKNIDNHNNLPFEQAMCTLTQNFEAMICVHVAKIAVKKFKALDEDFQTNANKRLLQFKASAKKLFMNIAYGNDSDGTCSILFDKIKEQLNEKIRSELSRKLVDEKLASLKHTKFPLLVQVLEELAEKGSFDEYMKFIVDVKNYCLSFLENKDKDSIAYKDIVDAYMESDIQQIEAVIKTAIVKGKEADSDKFSMEMFTEYIEENIKPYALLSKSEYKILKQQKIENVAKINSLVEFKMNKVREELQLLSKPGNIDWQGESPCVSVIEKVWGCTDHCPICLSPCFCTNPLHYDDENVKHECLQHWPKAISGIGQVSTQILVIDTCDFAVTTGHHFLCSASRYRCRESTKCFTKGTEKESHPYRDYETFLPHHEIKPDPSGTASKYWQHFMNKYAKDLVEYYNAKGIEDIPTEWSKISNEEAIDSLKSLLDD